MEKRPFLNPQRSVYKAMITLSSFILISCGSGGGGLDLGDNSGSCDDRPVTRQIGDGENVESTDKRAVVSSQNALPVTVAISVDCISSPSGQSGTQIGRGYSVTISQSGPVLRLSYANISLGNISESSLRVGEFDPGSSDWTDLGATPNDGLDEFTLALTLPSARYAIYSLTGGGGSNDITPPSQPTITSISKSPGAIAIAWTASTDDASGVVSYLINRAPDPGAQIDATNGTTLSYTDTGPSNHPLVAGVNYCYTVTAQDGSPNANRSLPSAQRCIVY